MFTQETEVSTVEVISSNPNNVEVDTVNNLEGEEAISNIENQTDITSDTAQSDVEQQVVVIENNLPEQLRAEQTSLMEAEPASLSTENEKHLAVFVHKNKKGLIIAASSVLFVGITFILLFILVIHPNQIYKKASAAFESGDYDLTDAYLEKIPKHKSAPALRDDVLYMRAKNAFLASDLDVAESYLTQIPNYEKTQALSDDITYTRAENAFLASDLDVAESYLTKIPDYEKTQALSDDITYTRAENALNSNNYIEASRLLQTIPNYPQYSDLNTRIIYAQALDYYNLGKYDEADSLLLSILFYEKTEALQQDIIYQRAVLAVDEKEYKEAEKFLSKIPNYNDSMDLKTIITYNNALEALNSGDYETAYTLMSTVQDYCDAKEQLDYIFFEALALNHILEFRDKLKDPFSIQVTKLDFYSTDDEQYAYLICEEKAANSYGGLVGATALMFTDDDGERVSGSISVSAYNDIVEDIRLGHYYFYEYDKNDLTVYFLMEIVEDGCKKEKTTVDYTRLNRLLQDKSTVYHINLDFDRLGKSVSN